MGSGDIARLRALLDADVDLRNSNEDGRVPLHWMAWNDHVNRARLLLLAVGVNTNPYTPDRLVQGSSSDENVRDHYGWVGSGT